MDEKYEALARSGFRWLNKYFMVPMFRLGLGPFLGTPFGGYIMVIKTVGTKTGKTRYAPTNYAIIDGGVYCTAGFGKTTHWYRNMKARPQVELLMPGGALSGCAEEVTAPDEWLRALRQILKNGGFAGYFMGFDPRTASDEVVREKCAGTPVIRIRPNGIGSGAGDPDGWLWVLTVLATIGSIWIGRRLLREQR